MHPISKDPTFQRIQSLSIHKSSTPRVKVITRAGFQSTCKTPFTLAFAGVADTASATAREQWSCYCLAITLAVQYFLVMVNKARIK